MLTILQGFTILAGQSILMRDVRSRYNATESRTLPRRLKLRSKLG